MYFIVANLMDKDRWPTLAASQFWDEVMQALWGVRRDGAFAEGADRVRFGHLGGSGRVSRLRVGS